MPVEEHSGGRRRRGKRNDDLGIFSADLDYRPELAIGALGVDDQRVKLSFGMEPSRASAVTANGTAVWFAATISTLAPATPLSSCAGEDHPPLERALLRPGHPEVANQLGLVRDGDFLARSSTADPSRCNVPGPTRRE